MKINDELTKKIAKLAAEIMTSAEKEQGEVRSKGEADFVNMHVDNIEVVDNRDEKLGKSEEPKKEKENAKKKTVKEEKEDVSVTEDLRAHIIGGISGLAGIGLYAAIITGIDKLNNYIDELKAKNQLEKNYFFLINKIEEYEQVIPTLESGKDKTNAQARLRRARQTLAQYEKQLNPVEKESLEEGTKEKKFLEDIAKESGLEYYDVKWLSQEQIKELIKLANDGNEIKAFKLASDYEDPNKRIVKKGYKIFDHEPVWQRFAVWIAYRKTVKEEKEEIEESLEEMKTTSDISMFGITIPKGTEVIPGENAAHFVRYDKKKFKFDKQLASKKGYKEPKDGTLLAINRDHKSLDESAKVLMEATPVKSDTWISELGNVIARSSDTKNLTMAYEAWANSLYKTPVWKSLMQNPLLDNLLNTLAESLDVYIGAAAETEDETDTEMGEALEGKEEVQETLDYRKSSDAELALAARNKDKKAEQELTKRDRMKPKTPEAKKSNLTMGEGKKYVISIEDKIYAQKGKAVTFTDKEKADNAVSKIKDQESMKDKKIKVTSLTEETVDAATVEKEFNSTKSDAEVQALIKKYSIMPAMSSVRPGELKLGIRNELNGNKSFVGLDNEGQIVIISGTQSAPKIRTLK